jgi:hypothetical protein
MVLADQSLRDWESKNFSAPVDQFFLLAAFSLENLLKGVALSRDPALIGIDKRGHYTLKGILRSHDLVELSRIVGLVLSREELMFCRLAGEASVYWGRYPVPCSSSEPIRGRAVTSSAFEFFGEFFVRTEQMYPQDCLAQAAITDQSNAEARERYRENMRDVGAEPLR